jgi:DNA-binding transcriptional LysR family regulator
MEIRELKTFVTVAHFKSMSKAADKLMLGQPTISGHIKKLENELGFALFDRVRRPIRLTPPGDRLFEIANRLVNDIEQLNQDMATIEEEAPVTVATTHEIMSHVLFNAIAHFKSENPALHLRIKTRSSIDVLKMLQENEADLGIVPQVTREPEFEFESMFPYQFVLITSKNHPLAKLTSDKITASDIAAWPLILMGAHTFSRRIVEAEFRRKGLSYDIILELDNMDSIKNYVLRDMGISIGPSIAIEKPDFKQLNVVHLDNLLPVEQAGLVTLKGKRLSSSAKNFINSIRPYMVQV